MLKEGDVLVAKINFLISHNIPYENRLFRVKECYPNTNYLEITNGEITLKGHFDLRKDFYYKSSLNYEINRLTEDENIEFKSFSGVTMDGKIIQIEAQLKY